jgi:NAD(P)H-hydrate epimerase
VCAVDGNRWLDREQSRRVDALAASGGTSGLELMERAGTACAERIWAAAAPRLVWIACGVGNNGGDGLVIARQLRRQGADVQVWLSGNTARMTAQTRVNLEKWLGLGESLQAWPPVHAEAVPDVAVDCLLGTGARGDPRMPIAEVIQWLNQLDCLRIAIDLPSGLDCDSGVPGHPTFRADWTLTMVGPKLGFAAAESAPFVGRWTVIDLGLPQELVDRACQPTAG